MVTLPVSDHPFQVQDVTLDSVPYRLALQWNERGQGWSLSFLTPQDVPILFGLRLALSLDVLRFHHHLAVPRGHLVPVDASGKLLSVGRDDLPSGAVKLVYQSPGGA